MSSTLAAARLKPAVLQYKVLYDGQCEICQSSVSWLRWLDKRHVIDPVPISAEVLSGLEQPLDLDACLRELHVCAPEGEVYVGWEAVAELARQFRWTWLIGTLGGLPILRHIGRAAYRWVARNRYVLSRCRGGVCRSARTDVVRQGASWNTFWSCYSVGFFIRLPLVVGSAIAAAARRVRLFLSTHHRRVELLHGKLTIYFLNGLLPNLVPLVFGELFTAIVYDGIAIDPGSPKMRRSLARHLRRSPRAVRAVVATHHHEEHVGNLNWLARKTNAKLYCGQATQRLLQPPAKLPWVRRTIIGQPPPLEDPVETLDQRLQTEHGELLVIPTPGHCDDHLALYDAKEKLLLAGDSFMGAYFSAPNPDVDSQVWVSTLKRLLEVPIEILVEGHGHIHTLRRDIPDIPGVVIREDPMQALREKLDYLLWVREQVSAGLQEGLSMCAIAATCFPWNRRSSWETVASDEITRVLSLGHFSRTQLVRSFIRKNDAVMPTVYEIRCYGPDSTDKQRS